MFYGSTIRCSTIPPSLFHCSTIRLSTVPPLDGPLFHHLYCSVLFSDVLLFHDQNLHCPTIRYFTVSLPHFHQMIHCSIMIVPLFQYQMFCCSTTRCSAVPPRDVLLFHHQMFHCSTIRCSTVPSADVLLFHHQMIHCCTIYSTDPPSLFGCSTIRCSTIPPSDVPLFHHHCSTVPASDGPLFHHLCSIVPPFLFPYSTIAIPLFHHDIIYCSTVPDISGVLRFHNQMFHSSTISVPLFHHQMFYCSTIRLSTVPPLDGPLFHHDCLTVPPSDVRLLHNQMFYCSSIRCYTISVPVFHPQMLHRSTISLLLFHH